MQQQRQLAGARLFLQPIRAEYDMAGAHLDPQPVQQRARQGSLDTVGQIVGDQERGALERACQRPLQMALRHGGLQRGAVHPQPRAPPRRPGARIGQHLAIGRQRQPQQVVLRRGGARQDAAAFRAGLSARRCRRRPGRAGAISDVGAQALIVRSPHARPPVCSRKAAGQPLPRPRTPEGPLAAPHLRTNARGRP